MGFDDGNIHIESDSGAFYAGQLLVGRLVFDQSKSKTIHGICIDFKGFCRVHWTTSHTRRVNDREEHYTVSHTSHEEYFRQKCYVFGDASGEYHLQAGHHEFRFQFQIPQNCPSTFEGSEGHVRYRVKAKMLTSGFFSSDKDMMVPVRVIAPLDLNLDPRYREPIEMEIAQSYCCWCVSAGSSEVQVKIPASGFCSGQSIPMEVVCKNPSSVDIDEIKFSINKNVKFIAESAPDTRTEHDTICKLTKGPVPAGATRTWNVEMEVPLMDIYNLDACRFIEIFYYIKVSTEISGCHSGEEDCHPITFGTVPIQGLQDGWQNPMQDQMPQIQNQNVQSSYPPPPVMNQPMTSPYPNGNQYPNGSAYPGAAPYPTPPNQPYPNVPPYPPQNPGNSPYPPNPYPGNSPYPPNPPYPPNQYPTNTPYPNTGTSPYPGAAGPGYPGASPVPPYPGGAPSTGPGPIKTGTFGFVGSDAASVPLLPPGANVPYPPTPYSVAPAPTPATPTENKSNLEADPVVNNSPPYNPDFKEEEKK